MLQSRLHFRKDPASLWWESERTRRAVCFSPRKAGRGQAADTRQVRQQPRNPRRCRQPTSIVKALWRRRCAEQRVFLPFASLLQPAAPNSVVNQILPGAVQKRAPLVPPPPCCRRHRHTLETGTAQISFPYIPYTQQGGSAETCALDRAGKCCFQRKCGGSCTSCKLHERETANQLPPFPLVQAAAVHRFSRNPGPEVVAAQTPSGLSCAVARLLYCRVAQPTLWHLYQASSACTAATATCGHMGLGVQCITPCDGGMHKQGVGRALLAGHASNLQQVCALASRHGPSVCACLPCTAPYLVAHSLPCHQCSLPRLGIVIATEPDAVRLTGLGHINAYASRHRYGFHSALIKCVACAACRAGSSCSGCHGHGGKRCSCPMNHKHHPPLSSHLLAAAPSGTRLMKVCRSITFSHHAGATFRNECWAATSGCSPWMATLVC